jgi:hypothetical protein
MSERELAFADAMAMDPATKARGAAAVTHSSHRRG